jgi:hypothetical protein
MGASNSRRHRTEVDCAWQVVADGEVRLLQLTTFGSDARQKQFGASQTLQFDPKLAAELLVILQRYVAEEA